MMNSVLGVIGKIKNDSVGNEVTWCELTKNLHKALC
jgi:hypothetical protein